MNWYLAKLIFSIDPEIKSIKGEFDEQLRLITAPTESDAYFKARRIGKEQEVKITGENTATIFWKFVDVSELIPLNEIKDGIEVYSTTHETLEKESFINSVRQKGIAIQSKNLLFC